MRLFIGIPLPAAVEAEVWAAVLRLRSENDGLRWTTPESWHITLQFLGNANAEQLACLETTLAGARCEAVTVRLGGLGVFDGAGVLLAEVEPAPGLIGLAQRVTAATAGCGFVAEERAYHPHITLARAKAGAGRRQLKALRDRLRRQAAFNGFTASEFVLYESHLGAGGAQYEARQRFRLAL